MKNTLAIILHLLLLLKSYGTELISTTSRDKDGNVYFNVAVIESDNIPSIVLIFRKDDSRLVLQEMLCRKAKIEFGGVIKDSGELYYVSSDGKNHKAFHLDLDPLIDKINVKSVDMSDPKAISGLVIRLQSRFDIEEEIVKRMKDRGLPQK